MSIDLSAEKLRNFEMTAEELAAFVRPICGQILGSWEKENPDCPSIPEQAPRIVVESESRLTVERCELFINHEDARVHSTTHSGAPGFSNRFGWAFQERVINTLCITFRGVRLDCGDVDVISDPVSGMTHQHKHNFDSAFEERCPYCYPSRLERCLKMTAGEVLRNKPVRLLCDVLQKPIADAPPLGGLDKQLCAIRFLGSIGDPAAVPVLVRFLVQRYRFTLREELVSRFPHDLIVLAAVRVLSDKSPPCGQSLQAEPPGWNGWTLDTLSQKKECIEVPDLTYRQKKWLKEMGLTESQIKTIPGVLRDLNDPGRMLTSGTHFGLVAVFVVSALKRMWDQQGQNALTSLVKRSDPLLRSGIEQAARDLAEREHPIMLGLHVIRRYFPGGNSSTRYSCRESGD